MTGLKTIAAYVPDAARAERVFVVAAQIAAQQNAHLTGYYVMPPEVTVPTFALGRQFVTAGRAALVDEAGKPEWDWQPPAKDEALIARVTEIAGAKIEEAFRITAKQARSQQLSAISDEVHATLTGNPRPD